jgi:glucokinase
MSDFWALGIEIGGTKLQLGIGNGRGSLLALDRFRVDPARGADGVLEQIKAAVPGLLAKAKLDAPQIQAVGIGFGGPVDVRNGRTRKSFQIAGWDDYALVGWIGEHLGIPRVVLENDADTAGLAEARFGAGVGHSPLLYITVGSGIGGALIIDQQIYRGSGGGATEVGHLCVPEIAPFEVRLRQLEQVASGWAIASTAREVARRKLHDNNGEWIVLSHTKGHIDEISTILVANAARAGDPDALTILDRATTAVAYALTQAITLLAPNRIVIGGGVSLIGDALWFDPIRRLVNRDVFGLFRGQFEIVPAALGEEVVVHGALALARNYFSPADSET